MNFLSGLASKVKNEFQNPESHLRTGLGKITNEFTNPESHLRNGRISAGIAVRNNSHVPLLVICSQITPLYWGRVEPGETWNVDNVHKMGVVWFTVSVSVYEERNVPTTSSVVAQIVALSAATILLPGALALGTVGLAMTTLSLRAIKGASKFGVYSNGQTLVVQGHPRGDEGVYELSFEPTNGPTQGEGGEGGGGGEGEWATPPPGGQWSVPPGVVVAGYTPAPPYQQQQQFTDKLGAPVGGPPPTNPYPPPPSSPHPSSSSSKDTAKEKEEGEGSGSEATADLKASSTTHSSTTDTTTTTTIPAAAAAESTASTTAVDAVAASVSGLTLEEKRAKALFDLAHQHSEKDVESVSHPGLMVDHKKA